LRKIDVQIFVICLNQESFGSSHLNQNLVKGATPLLTTLANETGGQVFFPKSVSELSTVIKQVTALSRTQYLIGYKPARPAEPSVYRRVSVKPLDQVERDKITVVVRTGYTVAEPRPAP
jgi:hypothetical protein